MLHSQSRHLKEMSQENCHLESFISRDPGIIMEMIEAAGDTLSIDW